MIVTGIVQANGLEIHNGKIYVAETQIDPSIAEMPMTSGVFCFDIAELTPRRAVLRGSVYTDSTDKAICSRTLSTILQNLAIYF